MSFIKLKQIMPQSAKLHQAEAQFIKYKVIRAWEEAAPGFFAEAGGLTRAINFEKGTLYVGCLSKDLCYAIRQLSPQILRAINELLGRNLVYSLVVEL